MSKLGTCRYAWQVQEMWQVPVHRQPHEPAETRIDMPEVYMCQWADQHAPLPPPIKRQNGAFALRGDDCDVCPHYAAPDVSWKK